jgi:hypothetical protein
MRIKPGFFQTEDARLAFSMQFAQQKKKKVIKCVISLQFAVMKIFRPQCSNKSLFTKLAILLQGSDTLMIDDYT